MYYTQRSCPQGTRPYTIAAGDTFYAISRRFNVPLDSLLQANPGVDPDRLMIGQVICVPAGDPVPDPSPTCPTLRSGSRGPEVIRLQQLLLDFGFNPGPADGIFGPRTRTAVTEFQREVNIAVDGIVGPRTWIALGVNCDDRPPGTCPVGTRSYTIRSGDTFYNLAIRYNTTVDAIKRANPTADPNRLRIGQRICIPS